MVIPQDPPTYTEADEKNIRKEAPDPDCDKKLAAIFGGQGVKASGSGYHPDGMMIGANPALGWNPHLFRTMHLFGNNTGTAAGQVYAPSGGGTPFSREKVAPGRGSWGIQYGQLGAVSNVTLVISHLKYYSNPGAITSRTLIGNIGGPGGNSGGKQPYIHSHLAILDSQGRNISFKDAFCR